MRSVYTLNHPLVGDPLRLMRDKGSSPEVFRAQVQRLSLMLALEASRDLQTKPVSVETPLQTTQEACVSQSIGIVPILRAGIGMADPFLDLIPQAQVWYLGMYRDHDTHEPVSYYNKLPTDNPVDVAYVLDPMLATGGSALVTIEAVKAWGVKQIKFIGLIGAPEGVSAVREAHPDVDIHLAALDEKLNENAYILPGLGDAGDRYFNSF